MQGYESLRLKSKCQWISIVLLTSLCIAFSGYGRNLNRIVIISRFAPDVALRHTSMGVDVRKICASESEPLSLGLKMFTHTQQLLPVPSYVTDTIRFFKTSKLSELLDLTEIKCQFFLAKPA